MTQSLYSAKSIPNVGEISTELGQDKVIFRGHGFFNVHTPPVAHWTLISSEGLDTESATLRLRRGGGED